MVVINKRWPKPKHKKASERCVYLSRKKVGLEELTDTYSFVNTGALNNNQTIVSNSRHVDALNKSLEQIIKTIEGLNSCISGDFL